MYLRNSLKILCLLLAGCVHNAPRHDGVSDISHAAVISDQIDSKAVVITEWLKTH